MARDPGYLLALESTVAIFGVGETVLAANAELWGQLTLVFKHQALA